MTDYDPNANQERIDEAIRLLESDTMQLAAIARLRAVNTQMWRKIAHIERAAAAERSRHIGELKRAAENGLAGTRTDAAALAILLDVLTEDYNAAVAYAEKLEPPYIEAMQSLRDTTRAVFPGTAEAGKQKGG